MDKSIINSDPASANASGFKAVNDLSNYIELVMPGSTNSLANNGQLTSPLSFSLNTSAAAQTISISTNGISRLTASDVGITIPNLSIGHVNITNTTGITLVVASTTTSTSPTTGCATFTGGVGINDDLWVNNGINAGGILTITNTTNATSPSTGAIISSGGIGASGCVFIQSSSTGPTVPLLSITNDATVTGTYSSVTLSPLLSASATVYRNFGVAQTLNNSIVDYFQYSSSGSTSNLYGLGFWGETPFLTATPQTVEIPYTTNSTSTTTGALTTPGGVGIAQDLYVGGHIYGNIATTSGTTIMTSNFTSSTPGGVSGSTNGTLNWTQYGNVILCAFSCSYSYSSSSGANNFYFSNFPFTTPSVCMTGICDNTRSNFTGATEPYFMATANNTVSAFSGLTIPANSIFFYIAPNTPLAFQVLGGGCDLYVTFLAYI